MHLKFRNVNDAFTTFVRGFAAGSVEGLGEVVRRPSRNGGVLVIDEPVLVTYSRPRERVLFNAARDANPFFHLYHSLWLLAGRNDVAAPSYYVKKFADYSDDGLTQNASYGHRWRNALTETGNAFYDPAYVDQIKEIGYHLTNAPNSRRAVLQMWNVVDDLLNVGGREPGDKGSKDVCCNLSVMFSLRDALSNRVGATGPCPFKVLDMTVTNRSNDLVWGMLGEDYVTFTVLQEYLAAKLGVEVGVYNHFTNNLHCYEWNWKPDEWLAWAEKYCDNEYASQGPKESPAVFSLFRDIDMFDFELPKFVEYNSKTPENLKPTSWGCLFLNSVAQPMMNAFHMHKLDDYAGAEYRLKEIVADDWRLAATNWIRKRKDKRS